MCKRIPLILPLVAAILPGAGLRAHESAVEMAEAAKVLLASLSEDQKAKVVRTLTDKERELWHFVPHPFEGEGMRIGLPLKDMRPDQRHLACALLSTGLSHRGYTTAMEIMSLEQVLWELENQAPKRDTLMYYVSIFGEPGSKTWGWRFEGHHLSLNFTVVDGKVVAETPNFFASNPGEVRQGPRAGLRVLAGEEDAARALVTSLDDSQKAKAILGTDAPEDILTSNQPKAGPLEGGGIAYADLTEGQKTGLKNLIDVYVQRVRPDVAADEIAAIEKAGLDKVVFAWLGGIGKGQPHYYRVQGPTFLLEYANTQNGANHVHSVWRDFDGDFGRDLLREHYQAHHRAK